jgi:hypothetical protein
MGCPTDSYLSLSVTRLMALHQTLDSGYRPEVESNVSLQCYTFRLYVYTCSGHTVV